MLLGDGLAIPAIPLLVLQLTHSAIAVAYSEFADNDPAPPSSGPQLLIAVSARSSGLRGCTTTTLLCTTATKSW
ncbi:hypothetical protein AB4305_07500 [Nocardia sp. 2YAB30]|uniref:hypothetical protein n=1 Tax=Nocardia sp. 2YAB30 TaxID=3233022 RepID=UPI003F9500C5